MAYTCMYTDRQCSTHLPAAHVPASLRPSLLSLALLAAGHWTHLRLHLWRCLIKGPFSAIAYLYTSTEVFNAWLRALGSKIGRQCWLSEMFHCAEFEMYEVEDTASVCR